MISEKEKELFRLLNKLRGAAFRAGKHWRSEKLALELMSAESDAIMALRHFFKDNCNVGAEDTKDAEFWRWLRDNAGKWSVSPDPLLWKDSKGREFRPKVAFTSHDTAYFGLTLEEAVTLAMKRPN